MKKGIKDVEQALKAVMLDAIDRTTRKVNIVSKLSCRPHSPRVVSAELYVRELISIFWSRFRKSLLPIPSLVPQIDILRRLLKVCLTGSTYDAEEETWAEQFPAEIPR